MSDSRCSTVLGLLFHIYLFKYLQNVFSWKKVWIAHLAVQHLDSSTMKPRCCNTCIMWFSFVLLKYARPSLKEMCRIHPSIFYCSARPGPCGQQLQQRCQDLPSPATYSSSSEGTHRRSHTSQETSSLQCVLGQPWRIIWGFSILYCE